MTSTVVLANGDFPTHPIPLSLLEKAETIVCCDGATQKLCLYGKEPNYIIGDMDSISPELFNRFKERIVPSFCQETNDLTKAIRLCAEKGFRHVHILGATGGREDHTLANISLLLDYAQFLKVEMITNTGIFIPLFTEHEVATVPGMQLSIFSLDPEVSLQAAGLKYPVDQVRFDSWWKGSLNEATGTTCRFRTSGGRLLLFLSFTGFHQLHTNEIDIQDFRNKYCC
jgi:thiamine pyrophosphokinase